MTLICEQENDEKCLLLISQVEFIKAIGCFELGICPFLAVYTNQRLFEGKFLNWKIPNKSQNVWFVFGYPDSSRIDRSNESETRCQCTIGKRWLCETQWTLFWSIFQCHVCWVRLTQASPAKTGISLFRKAF